MASPIPPLKEIVIPNADLVAYLRIFRATDETETEVDTFALVAQRYVVVIDTMATPAHAEGILDLLRPSLVGRQLLIVNTHADWDHCWGNTRFAPPDGPPLAPIIGHERAAERLLSDLERAVLAAKQRAEPRFASVRLVPPTITFHDGLRILGGDLTIELIPTPGHTLDHVSVWVPELRLLLAGDAAEEPFPEAPSAAGLVALRASLLRLRQLQPTSVFPCHGGTTDPNLLDRNLAYFAWIEYGVRQALDASHLPQDWATDRNLPTHLGLPFVDAISQVGSSLATPSEKTAAFYEEVHLKAVRATVASILG